MPTTQFTRVMNKETNEFGMLDSEGTFTPDITVRRKEDDIAGILSADGTFVADPFKDPIVFRSSNLIGDITDESLISKAFGKVVEYDTRIFRSGLNALFPGMGNELLLLDTPESARDDVLEYAEKLDNLEWYKKSPELIGWVGEKYLEYVVLKGIFRVTGATKLLQGIGNKAANSIFKNELIKIGGKSALIDYGTGLQFTKNVIRGTVRALPETTQFMGVWSGISSVKRGEKFSDGYKSGVTWGAILSAAVPLISETGKAAFATKTFEKAVLKFDTKFPNMSQAVHKMRGNPSASSQEMAFNDLKYQAELQGLGKTPDSLRITDMPKSFQNVIKTMGRRIDYIRNQETMRQMMFDKDTMRKGLGEAAETIAKDAQATVVDNITNTLAKQTKPTVEVMMSAKDTLIKIGMGKEAATDVLNKFTNVSDLDKFMNQTINLKDKLEIETLADKVIKESSPTYIVEQAEIAETKQLKKDIHILAREKNMYDGKKLTPLYREIAVQSTGKTSTTDMTKEQMETFKTAIQSTNTDTNKTIISRMIKASDSNAPIIYDDKQMRRKQDKLNKRKQNKRDKTNKRAITVERKGKQHDYINQKEPTRLAMSDLEESTGAIVEKLSYDVDKKSNMSAYGAEVNFGKIINGRDASFESSPQSIGQDHKNLDNMISTTTILENEQIKKYLFSEDSRKEVIDVMSEKTITIAKRLEYLLQEGPIARERMEESLRLWLDYKQAPGDQRGKVKKYDDDTVKIILEGGQKARVEGSFKQYVNMLFDNNIRFGLREYYYQSETGETAAIVDYIKSASGTGLTEILTSEAQPPSLFGSETFARKGKGSIKKGNVFTNIMNSYKRVAVRNAVAEDIKELYRRFNTVDLSNTDKQYLEDLYNKVLRKGELTRQPAKFLSKVSGVFWLANLSPITNFPRALQKIARNGLQPLAEGGQVVHARSFINNSRIVAQAMITGNFDNLDSEMVEDFRRSFHSNVSQKASIYKEGMFIDLGKKAQAEGLPSKVLQTTKLILEKTGGGYVGIDNLDRAIAWPAMYKSVKEAALRYKAGEISANKFFDLTQIDVMMKDAQVETATDLLQAGNIRELSNYVADMTVYDIHRAYRVAGRSGIERTTEQRVLTGIWTYPRGVYDLYMYRGVKRVYEGIIEGDIGKAKRASMSMAKGLLGRAISNTILVTLGYAGAYKLSRSVYNLLQPGTAIVAKTLNDVSMIAWQQSQGNITKEEALRAAAIVVYEGLDDLIKILPDLDKEDEPFNETFEK